MMEEKKQGETWYWRFLVCGCIALSCVVLIIIGIVAGDEDALANIFREGTLVQTETVYLTVILAFLLPAAILAITIVILAHGRGFLWMGKKERKKAKQDDGVRFRALASIDRGAAQAQVPARVGEVPMFRICEDFRAYAAANLHLYYEPEDIRRFVAGFAVSHLMIMQGLSGTGKTSLATAFGAFLGNPSAVISVQPMWKERADVIGYFNEFTKQFNESALLKRLYEARYSDDICIIVLDEMNIARVEYFFADFLSLMELNPADRCLEMTSDSWEKDPLLFENGRFRIPTNVWFIGTANNDDSTFAISDKVYDRAMVMNLDTKAKPFSAAQSGGMRLSYSGFCKAVEHAKEAYSMTARNRRKVAEIDRYLTENYHITYGNRIRKQMEEYISLYIACGGTEEEALDDFLMKKVLRKLEGQNPVVIAKAGKALGLKITELFGYDSMPLCRSYLHYLCQSVS